MSYEIKSSGPAVIKCPFCDKGEIHTVFTPSHVETQVSRGSGINRNTKVFIDEKYIVEKGCPNCGKSGAEIQKALNQGGGETKPPSREEILRRIREAGLDTKVTTKRKSD